MVAAFAWCDRSKLTLALFPRRLLVFVVGLFLVVPTLSRYGLASANTSWASLPTLLWFEWCRQMGARVPMLTFVLAGTALVAVGVIATVTVLLLTV
ncbi:hypothetical protein [Streptosporangium sp. OZ121]|uniref:hypothetical protein n=1 Tax=Streptosporangium sp. OZ121 TaxID=3444183 RepID=UPI003F7A14C8